MAQRRNVLLIAVEALRLDRLGCYGGSGAHTPSIDALAASGARASAFYSSATPVEAAWGALITGMHPVNLGIASARGGTELVPGITVLAEPFLSAGYTTCTYDNLRRRIHWFGNGSEYYIDAGVRYGRAATPAETNSRAIPWLRNHSQEPFFGVIRYSHPFRAGERMSFSEYESYVAEVDSRTGELLGALEQLRLAPNTLVVFLGLSGWSLGEHGVWGDTGLYECTNRLPLIVRCPQTLASQTEWNGSIATQDLAPTIMEACDLHVPPQLDGVSFWKALLGSQTWTDREAIFAIDNSSGWQRWSIRKGGWKLIATLAQEPEAAPISSRSLYRLDDDPQEQRDLEETENARADDMSEELINWRSERLKEWATMEMLLED